METTPTGSLPTVPPPAPGAFRWQKVPPWLVCCAVLGLLVAWAAVVARGYASPLVLFPLVVGTILGGAVVLLMRVLHVGHRPTIWLGALLAGLLAVAGQHYFTFWRVEQRFARDPNQAAKRLFVPDWVPPQHFGEFMLRSAAEGIRIGCYTARGGLAWLVWSLDGLLVLVPAVLLVGATARLPYCDRCRQWYQTTRSGRIDSPTVAALSAVVPTGLEGEIERGRYRLIACRGGCGPTGLVLSGEQASGRSVSQTVWLDAARRQRIVAILDEAARRQAEEEPPSASHGRGFPQNPDHQPPTPDP